MPDLPRACTDLRAQAPELALGTLDGSARGAALEHVAGCAPCRAHVQELAEVVDRLLSVAPEAEPPPGFESGVIERITAERAMAENGRRRGPSRLVLAVAAAVLVLAGAVGGFLLGERGTDVDDGGLATSVMVAPGGEEVGEVWRYGDADTTVFVSVPAWAAIDGEGGPRYALRLGLEGGDTLEVGDFGLGDGRSSWGATAEVEAASIRSVSVIDDTGRVWCTGEFA